MRIGYHTITWGGVVSDPVGVTSVKDLFYRAHGSMERAIVDIAHAGYEGIEMFDGNVADFADRPGRLRGLLADTGLELVSVYTGANFVYDDILPDELHKVSWAAELAAQEGATHLVVGGGARRARGTTGQDYGKLATALDKVMEIAESKGLSACYHPHLTTIVESPDELDQLFSRTSIGFCPDTAHLFAGGGDPAALVRKYPERIQHVHLKDARVNPLRFLPIGEGDIDFGAVLAALLEVGYDGWLMVELDSFDGNPRDAAVISKSYVDKLIRQ